MERHNALHSLVLAGLSPEQADAVAQLVYALNAETVGAVRDELRT